MSLENSNDSVQKNINNRDFFNGNIYFFYSFDIGDDIDLRQVHDKHAFARTGTFQSQFFKSYHKPLVLDIKAMNFSEYCDSAYLYNFGAISLRYKFQFNSSLDSLRKIINSRNELFSRNSIDDARIIFNAIKKEVRQARFFHLSMVYALVQVNTKENINPYLFKDKYGNEIASVLRFETENLSDYKKNEILESAFGYYRGDLLIIDCNSALVYDNEYEDILDIFEFANIRNMELQYFDKALDKQLNFVYERQAYKIPIKAYFPILGMFKFDPIGELAKLRVDISVVSERLWSSIKFSGEPYYLEIYRIISEKLDYNSWQESIDKKLEVIRHILEVHENRVSSIRYDVLNILIVVLIFIEVLFAFVRG
jgi:uncharacterized Rmd1/YagE family protein